MPNTLTIGAATTSTTEIEAQIADLQAKLTAARSAPQIEIVNVPFFKHNGSATRPANIPDNARVVYFHSKDGALCVTHSNKRKQWADVDLYIVVDESNFRSFVRSKSRRAR